MFFVAFVKIDTDAEIDQVEAEISSRINELKDLLLHFQAPNARVDEK